MSTANGRGGSHGSTPTTTLRLLRLGEGETEVVRMLAETYLGCLTHFHEKRSRYCPGSERCTLHGKDAVWKGYTSAELWVQAGSMWVPVVLEITESLDQDLFPRYKRGQVWQLTYHARKAKNKKAGIEGQLLEQRDAFTFPEPYDLRPVLCSLYHVPEVKLSLPNPMPRRIQVVPSMDSGPRQLTEELPSSRMTPDEMAHWMQVIRTRNKLPPLNCDGEVKGGHP